MCPFCGADARRQSVNSIGFSGFASTPVGQQDFAQDYRRYREASEQIDDQVTKRERDVGHEISTTSLYKNAKAKFKDLHSKGVNADSIST